MNTKKNRLSFEVFYNWFIRHDKNTCIYDIRNQSVDIPGIGVVLYFNDIDFDPTFKSMVLKNGANKLVFTGIKYIDIIKEDVISTIINIVFKNNICKDVTLLLR